MKSGQRQTIVIGVGHGTCTFPKNSVIAGSIAAFVARSVMPRR